RGADRAPLFAIIRTHDCTPIYDTGHAVLFRKSGLHVSERAYVTGGTSVTDRRTRPERSRITCSVFAWRSDIMPNNPGNTRDDSSQRNQQDAGSQNNMQSKGNQGSQSNQGASATGGQKDLNAGSSSNQKN